MEDANANNNQGTNVNRVDTTTNQEGVLPHPASQAAYNPYWPPYNPYGYPPQGYMYGYPPYHGYALPQPAPLQYAHNNYWMMQQAATVAAQAAQAAEKEKTAAAAKKRKQAREKREQEEASKREEAAKKKPKVAAAKKRKPEKIAPEKREQEEAAKREEAAKKKPKIYYDAAAREKREQEEATKKYDEAARKVSDMLEKYLEEAPGPKIGRRWKVIPSGYGETRLLNLRYGYDDDDWLSRAFFYFLHEVGWIATHLMWVPYTEYRVITEQNIRQCLNTMMHPKHWSSTRGWYHKLIPGFPSPFEPGTVQEEAMYVGKNLKMKNGSEEKAKAIQEEKKERKRLEDSNQEDPDGLIRAAADAGVYLCEMLNRVSCGIGGFSGEVAANCTGFDEEKDKAREPMHRFCETMCINGSRALFEKLTSSDKAQIDSILGPGYSDLPSILDITALTCTGAEEFDKVCPLPPPEYRLDACNMLPYIQEGIMHDRTGWGCVSPILTPQAAAILTAALSAILYKTHRHQLEKNSEEEKSLPTPPPPAAAAEITVAPKPAPAAVMDQEAVEEKDTKLTSGCRVS